jgi:hypothetical protein
VVLSVILNGGNRKILMTGPGRPMLAGPLPNTVVTSLDQITGLTGWWDAGLASGVVNTAGAAMTRFGGLAGGVADKSGVGTDLAVWHAASSGTMSPVATPRLNGLLGGVGLNMVVPPMQPAAGQQLPVMDPDRA